MKIPASVFIKGKEWKVKRVWRLRVEGEDCDGTIDGETREIKIVHGLNKEELLDTYLHEFLHAIWFEYGLYHFIGQDVSEIMSHNYASEFINNFQIKPRIK